MDLRKLLMLVLMLILPLQGVAAAFAPMHRAPGGDATSSLPCHETPDAHSADAPQHSAALGASDTSAPDPTRDADAASHLCCHQVATCASACTLATPAQKFGEVLRFVLPLATLFIPDSPDRPPRG